MLLDGACTEPRPGKRPVGQGRIERALHCFKNELHHSNGVKVTSLAAQAMPRDSAPPQASMDFSRHHTSSTVACVFTRDRPATRGGALFSLCRFAPIAVCAPTRSARTHGSSCTGSSSPREAYNLWHPSNLTCLPLHLVRRETAFLFCEREDT